MEGAREVGGGHSNSGHHTECLLCVRRCIMKPQMFFPFIIF